MLNQAVTARWLLLTVLISAHVTFPLFAEVIISEFMASNTRTLADEDGEYSDWIELYNSGAISVSLNGWALTDSAADLQKWRFPAVTIGGGETLLVFASNKDRRIPGAPLHTNFKLSSGEYLALVDPAGRVAFDFGAALPEQVPDVSFGVLVEKKDVILIDTNASARFWVPRDASLEPLWSEVDFEDTSWLPGTNGFGFDRTGMGYGSVLRTDVGSAMAGISSSIYLRIPFQAPEVEFHSLTLRMLYDDGFVASLNGVPLAAQNAPGDPGWNAAATAEHSAAAALTPEEFDLSAQVGLVHAGENVLAIQGLNVSAENGSLLQRAELVGSYSIARTNVWRYFVQPTPNAVNGLGDTNLGPLILDASFKPQIPKVGESITVTAKMQQTFNPIMNLTLAYTVMFGTETNITMWDDGQHGDGAAGDGVYGGIINSGASAGQMVRWYLRATDNKGLTSRWPPFLDAKNSPQYLGTAYADATLSNALPVMQWFVKTPASADGSTGTRCSIFWKGILYDNVFVNVHGQSSLAFPKKSYNLNFNTGYHFRYSETGTPIGKVNLLTTYPDKAHMRNILAYETFRDAGHAYHFVIPVRVQRNGAFFSDAHMVEDGDSDYLERNGLDGQGALYKMYNTLDSSTSGVEKKTRTFEKNADLAALIRGLASSTSRTAFIYDNVNIAAMVNYLAALTMSATTDCCHKNYYLYRDTRGSGEWQMLPWDMDLTFGRNWTGDYYDDRMYPQNDLYVGSNNALVAALFSMSDFKAMYHRRLRTLMDQMLQPPGTPTAELKYEKRMDELLAVIAPDAALDFAKWPTWGTKQTMPQAVDIIKTNFLPQRRTFLYVTKKTTIPNSMTNQITIDCAGLDFNPVSGSQKEEYICLTNLSTIAVDLSGWRLSGGVTHRFAPGTVLPVKGTIYLSPDVNSFRRRVTGPRGGQRLFIQGNYQGQLSARGETLILRDAEDRLVQTFSYSGQPTAGQQFLRISEIMYAPSESTIPEIGREELEYIVLKNIGNAAYNLNGVRFTSGIEFTFTKDVVLSAGERIYLAKNPTAFKTCFGDGLRVAGPYLGQLANEGEILQLEDGVGEKIVSFAYSNKWYSSANGSGSSLVMADEQTTFDSFSEKAAWLPSVIAGGSAGTESAWAAWRNSHFTAGSLNDLTISGREADPDHDGFSNLFEFIAGTDPADGNSRLSITLSEHSTGAIVLKFPAMPGRQYCIYRTENLERNGDAPWQRVQALPRSATAQAIEAPLPASVGTAFYRVAVEL